MLQYTANQIYTYHDYEQWPEDERYELIEGVPYAMASPRRIHQEIVLGVGAQLFQQLSGKPCQPFIAPFDVLLPLGDEADEDVRDVVQPDVLVVCDENKLNDKRCRGAPDWVIEVLSPSTSLKDMHVKRKSYELHGVREYWVIHPTDRWVMVYVLDGQGKYGHPEMFMMQEPIASRVLPELQVAWGFLPAKLGADPE